MELDVEASRPSRFTPGEGAPVPIGLEAAWDPIPSLASVENPTSAV
jgi:hypothetical protein